MSQVQETQPMDLTSANVVVPSILAGISIGIAALCNLKGGQYIGAALFAFGLGTVVCSKWYLFTGMIGFIKDKETTWKALISLPLNAIGVVLACFLAAGMGVSVTESATTIAKVRLTMTPVQLILMGAGCGFIMTASVYHARKGQWIPLLFGIPTFIMCGFPHCVADITYYYLSDYDWSDFGMAWLYSVIGNAIGCNIPSASRFFKNKNKKKTE